MSLGELDTALELAEASGSELKWRQLGELALSTGKLQARPASHMQQLWAWLLTDRSRSSRVAWKRERYRAFCCRAGMSC